MKKIENTPSQALALAQAIIDSGVEPVFDLDGVLLDATHRQSIYTADHVALGICNEDQIGQLDLDAYRAHTTAEKVNQDKNLPLMAVIDKLNQLDVKYHVATARVITRCPHSSKLLKDRGIKPASIMCRDGEHDKRRDSHLKQTKLVAKFSDRQRANMVLIDDSLGNCKAAMQIGMKAIHVPFRGF